MGGKSAPKPEPAPAPPTPIPDENATMKAPSGAPPGAIQAAIDEENKKNQAGMTLGSAAQAKPMTKKKIDPASMVQQAPAGGVASSSVLTG